MGKREISLKELIYSIYGGTKYAKLTSAVLLNSEYVEKIYAMYSAFDGVLAVPPTNFGGWDISTERFIIELDEERHFNRYRLKTLESSFYLDNNFFQSLTINFIVRIKRKHV